MKMDKDSLQKRLNVGTKLKIYYGEINPSNEIIEIRGIVDDEYYVVRSYSKRKKMWNYRVESIYFFQFRDKDNILKFIKG
jgi:hypothetical protein